MRGRLTNGPHRYVESLGLPPSIFGSLWSGLSLSFISSLGRQFSQPNVAILRYSHSFPYWGLAIWQTIFHPAQRSYIALRTNTRKTWNGTNHVAVYMYAPDQSVDPASQEVDLTVPCQVRNLDERIKIPALTEALRDIFGEFGEIIDIVAKKNLKAKGQAFVVFNSIDAAQDAIDSLQGFDLFDKPMTLAFAKTRSDATVEKEDGEAGLATHKQQRLAEKGEDFDLLSVTDDF